MMVFLICFPRYPVNFYMICNTLPVLPHNSELISRDSSPWRTCFSPLASPVLTLLRGLLPGTLFPQVPQGCLPTSCRSPLKHHLIREASLITHSSPAHHFSPHHVPCFIVLTVTLLANILCVFTPFTFLSLLQNLNSMRAGGAPFAQRGTRTCRRVCAQQRMVE